MWPVRFKSKRDVYEPPQDPAVIQAYQYALAEWRALRSKPFASRTPEDNARCSVLFKFISSFAIPY